MIDKTVATATAAVADIGDGATVMIGGFGTAGMPSELIDALIGQGARDLTIVNNNAGNGEVGLAALLKAKRVRKIGPIMAAAAKCTIVQVREVVNLGDLDPEAVVTPGIYVRRVVEIPAAAKFVAQPGAAA